jgi:hypothetical protein
MFTQVYTPLLVGATSGSFDGYVPSSQTAYCQKIMRIKTRELKNKN